MANCHEFARRYADAWANPDSSAFVALFTPDAEYRDDQVGRISKGRDELYAFHAHFVQAISNIRMETPRAFRSGNDVCLEWTFIGSHTGVYHGREPTGVTFSGKGVAIIRLSVDGLIASVIDYYDSAPVQRQLASYLD